MIVIDTHSPERGWKPFMEWMCGQGLAPEQCRSITIDPEAMTAEVVLFEFRDGKHYVVGDEVATRVEGGVPLSSLPPRRGQTAA